MNVGRRLLTALLGAAVCTTAAAQTAAPTLSRPTTPESAPAADGFLQRWLVLEPIAAEGLTDSAVQAAVKKEYFPGQLTVVPHDGDTVTVGDAPLRWQSAELLAQVLRELPCHGDQLVVGHAQDRCELPQEVVGRGITTVSFKIVHVLSGDGCAVFLENARGEIFLAQSYAFACVGDERPERH